MPICIVADRSEARLEQECLENTTRVALDLAHRLSTRRCSLPTFEIVTADHAMGGMGTTEIARNLALPKAFAFTIVLRGRVKQMKGCELQLMEPKRDDAK